MSMTLIYPKCPTCKGSGAVYGKATTQMVYCWICGGEGILKPTVVNGQKIPQANETPTENKITLGELHI